MCIHNAIKTPTFLRYTDIRTTCPQEKTLELQTNNDHVQVKTGYKSHDTYITSCKTTVYYRSNNIHTYIHAGISHTATDEDTLHIWQNKEIVKNLNDLMGAAGMHTFHNNYYGQLCTRVPLV